jgi:hypothetical protein
LQFYHIFPKINIKLIVQKIKTTRHEKLTKITKK